MIIVCGDSISAGQYLPPGKAWPDLLGYENRSVSNDTTRLMLERFPHDIQASGAERCVIQVGHNDANRWATDNGLNRVSPGAFHENLREMIYRCQAFRITPVLTTITPVRRTDEYQRDLADYNNTIIGVSRYYSLTLINIREALLQHDLGKVLLDDGLHLSEQGQELYAAHVKLALS